jgi:hypothetical protein
VRPRFPASGAAGSKARLTGGTPAKQQGKAGSATDGRLLAYCADSSHHRNWRRCFVPQAERIGGAYMLIEDESALRERISKWCNLSELDLPVEPNWRCRLWRI